MKVLLTAEQLVRPVPGGIGTYICGLLQGLHQLDEVDSTLLLPRGEEPKIVKGENTVHSNFNLRAMVKLWDLGLLRSPQNFDVVHASSLAVPAKGRTPMTTTIHDLGWRHLPNAYPWRGRRWHEAALKRALQRSNVVITPSIETADDLIKSGVAQDRIAVINLGCDHLPEADVAGAVKRLNELGITGKFILTVGTFEPRKNLERLIFAHQLLNEKLSEPLPLLIVGARGWGNDIRPVANVNFLHDVSGGQLAGLYKSAYFLASVPLLEGFGFPPLEAMFFGLPVVASNVPSAQDAVQVVDPLDVDSIFDGLLQVATNEQLRAELIEKGRRRVVSATWKVSAQSHLDVWNAL